MHLGAFSLAEMRKLALGRDGSGRWTSTKERRTRPLCYPPIWIGLFLFLDSLLFIFASLILRNNDHPIKAVRLIDLWNIN